MLLTVVTLVVGAVGHVWRYGGWVCNGGCWGWTLDVRWVCNGGCWGWTLDVRSVWGCPSVLGLVSVGRCCVGVRRDGGCGTCASGGATAGVGRFGTVAVVSFRGKRSTCGVGFAGAEASTGSAWCRFRLPDRPAAVASVGGKCRVDGLGRCGEGWEGSGRTGWSCRLGSGGTAVGWVVSVGGWCWFVGRGTERV